MTQHDDTTPAGADDRDTAKSAGMQALTTAVVNGEGATMTASDAPGGPVTVDEVRAALRRVKDPELNLNIVDLGLIYDIAVDGPAVSVNMSLTSPGCPSGPEIMRDAENQVKAMDGVGAVTVNLVWSPIWTPERIEPRVRAYMGF